MANRLFSETPAFSKPRRNAFNLSFLNLLSSNFGDLKVCLIKETVPGDLWQCQSTALVRVAPMLAPVMANMDVYIHYFYVPNRIIWSHWNDFITGGIKGDLDPSNDPEVIPPYFSLDSDLFEVIDNVSSGYLFGERSLWDSVNLPSVEYTNFEDFSPEEPLDKISSLPFRAYQLVYQEYYEDELLKRPFLDPDTGEDVPINFSVSGNELLNGGVSQVLRLLWQQKRAWGKDYFTTARPNVALTGDTLIPITGSGSFSDLGVSGTGVVDFTNTYPSSMPVLRNTNGQVIQDDYTLLYGDLGSQGNPNYQMAVGYMDDPDTPHYEFAAGAFYDPNGSLKVDGSDFEVTGDGDFNIQAGTIRDLKLAIQTFEYDAKGQYGNRPTEWHYNHFGVIVPDKTIQRPIYLGGGKTPIMVSEVLQTAGSDYSAASGKTATPQGNMAGHGIGVANSNRFRHYCEEYGFIIGIMSIIPKTAYYQGVPKMFSRFDKLDYFTPEFAHIGEVPVLNKELYFDVTTDNKNEETFGYQSPYADLKFSNNEIHGDFRNSLEFWHTGRKFSQLPSLNWEFIHCDHQDQLSRIFAVESEDYDHFLTQIYHNLKVTRLMPKFGTFKL